MSISRVHQRLTDNADSFRQIFKNNNNINIGSDISLYQHLIVNMYQMWTVVVYCREQIDNELIYFEKDCNIIQHQYQPMGSNALIEIELNSYIEPILAVLREMINKVFSSQRFSMIALSIL